MARAVLTKVRVYCGCTQVGVAGVACPSHDHDFLRRGSEVSRRERGAIASSHRRQGGILCGVQSMSGESVGSGGM